GGGAYIVAHENLGVKPALIAAAALLVDYVLTVAVSVAAGVAAITSAAPELFDLRVPLSLLAGAVITWGNLRGVRESGAIFGLPTYFFIVCFSGMIVVGLVKLVIGGAPGTLLHTAPASQQIVATSGLTIFLVLRAFSSGAAAVTGIEAISNGVPAFKPPESRNAQITMQWEAAFLGFFLLGVAFLRPGTELSPSRTRPSSRSLGGKCSAGTFFPTPTRPGQRASSCSPPIPPSLTSLGSQRFSRRTALLLGSWLSGATASRSRTGSCSLALPPRSCS
ncbi:MAG: APC family permease, partial [Chloroflexi bacterium]